MNRAALRSRVIVGAAVALILTGCMPAYIPSDTSTTEDTQPPVPTITSTLDAVASATASAGLSVEATAIAPTPSPTTSGRFVTFEEQPAEIGYTLPLTIQHQSGTGAWLYFELENPAAGEVFYWFEGKEEQGVYSVEFDAESREHLVEITDLQPDTSYKIRVGILADSGRFRSPGLNGEVWGETTLTTYPKNLDHLRVGVIGDSGFGESVTYALTAQMAAQKPDFVIHTGDIAYSAFENGTPLQAYQAKYFWPFQKILLQAPVYAVPGNHEYYDDASEAGIAYYFSVFPPLREYVSDGSWVGSDQDFRTWYAVRLMGYQFLFLESQRFYQIGGAAEETEWLRRTLEDFQAPTIATYHIATYTSGSHERDGIPIRQSWLPYFQEANTALILSGHDHNYERLQVDELNFIVSGGGSAVLYALDQPVEGSNVFAAESHFVLLDIYSDRIEVEAVNAFGDIIDRTTMSTKP